jgi:hypothetical protein
VAAANRFQRYMGDVRLFNLVSLSKISNVPIDKALLHHEAIRLREFILLADVAFARAEFELLSSIFQLAQRRLVRAKNIRTDNDSILHIVDYCEFVPEYGPADGDWKHCDTSGRFPSFASIVVHLIVLPQRRLIRKRFEDADVDQVHRRTGDDLNAVLMVLNVSQEE